MRFPWLQVDVDFIGSRSKDLAALLRVSRREAMGLAIDLWTWVLGRASGDTPPDGFVRGQLETVELLIAGGVDWIGDPKHLVISLETSGLLEYVDGGVRVRGMSRYKATWEKNRRRHGTGAEPERNRSGSPPEPARKTQTQTQKVEAIPPPSSAAPLEELRLEPQQAARRVASKKPKPEKPADPRHAPLTQELCEVHGWPHHGGRTARAVTELLALADQAPGTSGPEATWEINRRAALARASEGFPRVRELHELVTHWGHFAETAPRSTGPPRFDPNQGILRADGRVCAACGEETEVAGAGGVLLCYGSPILGSPPGCLDRWNTAIGSGEWRPDQVHEWARTQRRAA